MTSQIRFRDHSSRNLQTIHRFPGWSLLHRFHILPVQNRSRVIFLKLAEVTSLDFIVYIVLDPFFKLVLPAIVSAAPYLPNFVGMGQPTYGILIYLINGCPYGWLAHQSRTLWMPIGFYWGNNFGITVLIGVENSGDLLQGATTLVADKCHYSTS